MFDSDVSDLEIHEDVDGDDGDILDETEIIQPESSLGTVSKPSATSPTLETFETPVTAELSNQTEMIELVIPGSPGSDLASLSFDSLGNNRQVDGRGGNGGSGGSNGTTFVLSWDELQNLITDTRTKLAETHSTGDAENSSGVGFASVHPTAGNAGTAGPAGTGCKFGDVSCLGVEEFLFEMTEKVLMCLHHQCYARLEQLIQDVSHVPGVCEPTNDQAQEQFQKQSSKQQPQEPMFPKNLDQLDKLDKLDQTASIDKANKTNKADKAEKANKTDHTDHTHAETIERHESFPLFSEQAYEQNVASCHDRVSEWFPLPMKKMARFMEEQDKGQILLSELQLLTESIKQTDTSFQGHSLSTFSNHCYELCQHLLLLDKLGDEQSQHYTWETAQIRWYLLKSYQQLSETLIHDLQTELLKMKREYCVATQVIHQRARTINDHQFAHEWRSLWQDFQKWQMGLPPVLASVSDHSPIFDFLNACDPHDQDCCQRRVAQMKEIVNRLSNTVQLYKNQASLMPTTDIARSNNESNKSNESNESNESNANEQKAAQYPLLDVLSDSLFLETLSSDLLVWTAKLHTFEQQCKNRASGWTDSEGMYRKMKRITLEEYQWAVQDKLVLITERLDNSLWLMVSQAIAQIQQAYQKSCSEAMSLHLQQSNLNQQLKLSETMLIAHSPQLVEHIHQFRQLLSRYHDHLLRMRCWNLLVDTAQLFHVFLEESLDK